MAPLCSVYFLLVSAGAKAPESLYDIAPGGDSGNVGYLYSIVEENGVIDAQRPTRSQRTPDKRLSRRRSSSTAGSVQGRQLWSTLLSTEQRGLAARLLTAAALAVAAVLVLRQLGRAWRCLTQHDGYVPRKHAGGKAPPRLLSVSQQSDEVCLEMSTGPAPPHDAKEEDAPEPTNGRQVQKPEDGFDFKKLLGPVLLLYALAFIAYVVVKLYGYSDRHAVVGFLVVTMVSGRALCYGLAYYGKKLYFRLRARRRRRREEAENRGGDLGTDNPVFVISSTRF